MAEYNDLFLFGDDLEAVLEALETDDNADEYFEEAVTEVSVGIRFYSNLQQRSRSLWSDRLTSLQNTRLIDKDNSTYVSSTCLEISVEKSGHLRGTN